ncbi:MAG: recombinase [Clostridia bacterium]|nr:recombinase [Clostridia bacterium]
MKKFIDEFEQWLKNKELAKKTIKRHISNIELYLNDFLNYYEIITMEKGIDEVGAFLNGWFIEKCMWATPTSLKEMISSLKKFYQCMAEKGYVKNEDYKYMCEYIKENKDDFLESLEDFDNGTYYDIF